MPDGAPIGMKLQWISSDMGRVIGKPIPTIKWEKGHWVWKWAGELKITGYDIETVDRMVTWIEDNLNSNHFSINYIDDNAIYETLIIKFTDKEDAMHFKLIFAGENK